MKCNWDEAAIRMWLDKSVVSRMFPSFDFRDSAVILEADRTNWFSDRPHHGAAAEKDHKV